MDVDLIRFDIYGDNVSCDPSCCVFRFATLLIDVVAPRRRLKRRRRWPRVGRRLVGLLRVYFLPVSFLSVPTVILMKKRG
jgi:hypothetical protein